MLRVFLSLRVPLESRIRSVGLTNALYNHRSFHYHRCTSSSDLRHKYGFFQVKRFYSDNKPKGTRDEDFGKKDNDSLDTEKNAGIDDFGNGEQNVTIGDIMNNAENELKEVTKFPSGLPNMVGNPQGRPPEMPIPQFMTDKPRIDHRPQDNYERVTYEFHVPPSPTQRDNAFYIKRYFREKWYEFIPMAVLLIYGAWMVFAWYFISPPDKEDEELLSPKKFLPYLITYKEKLDDDWYLIEVTRRRRILTLINTSMKGRGLFDGESLWSVEVKQPDINIVRNLTPIPVYIPGINPMTKEPHFRLVDQDIHDGRFVFLVKRYEHGEFSRWFTSLNLLSEVELRGPIVEYKFPAHPLDREDPRPQMHQIPAGIKIDPEWSSKIAKPNDFVFFGAGTGISPILQVLLSPNPPKGFVDAYISLPSESCLPAQFKTLNYFMEKAGRAKFHYIYSDKGDRLDVDYVPRPSLPKFSGAYDKILSDEMYKQKLKQKNKTEVQTQITSSGSIMSIGDKISGFFSSSSLPGKAGEKSQKEIEIMDKKEEEEVKAGKKFIALDETNKDEYIPTKVDIDFDPRIFPDNAIILQERKKIYERNERIGIWGKLYSKMMAKSQRDNTTGNYKSECGGDPSLAIVCGPEKYITDVSGKPDLNNLELKDTGPIGGYLKEKGWDLNNVKRLY